MLTVVKFSEKTYIFPLLTPLLPKIGLTDGKITPDFLTCPLNKCVFGLLQLEELHLSEVLLVSVTFDPFA